MTAIFESILNISISALWLILAAICARALLFRAPKWTRMLLWALVAVRLILPFTVESPLSLVPETKAVDLTIREADSPNAPAQMEIAPTEQTSITPITPIIPGEPATPEVPVTPGDPIAPSLPITNEDPEKLPAAELPADGDTAKAEEKPVNVGFILSVVWIAGIALMAGYFAFSYLSLRFRLRDAVRGEGRVWYSDRIDTAFIFGIINARIYLPFGIEGTAAEHVLAHERAHLKRGDHIIKPLAFFILSLHWFNPAVWIAYILFCKDVELACDEAVIRGMSEEKVSEYSHALVSLSTKGSRLSLHPISFGGASMKNRLKNILNYKKADPMDDHSGPYPLRRRGSLLLHLARKE